MIVVADTTPLSELAKIGRLEILRDIFGGVIIPQEVYDEVTVGNYPAATQVPVASWIEVQPVGNVQMVQTIQAQTDLDLGECAAIVLAQELKADKLLIDDLDARKIAKSKGLQLIGTVGVLHLAKENGLIFRAKGTNSSTQTRQHESRHRRQCQRSRTYRHTQSGSRYP